MSRAKAQRPPSPDPSDDEGPPPSDEEFDDDPPPSDEETEDLPPPSDDDETPAGSSSKPSRSTVPSSSNYSPPPSDEETEDLPPPSDEETEDLPPPSDEETEDMPPPSDEEADDNSVPPEDSDEESPNPPPPPPPPPARGKKEAAWPAPPASRDLKKPKPPPSPEPPSDDEEPDPEDEGDEEGTMRTGHSSLVYSDETSPPPSDDESPEPPSRRKQVGKPVAPIPDSPPPSDEDEDFMPPPDDEDGDFDGPPPEDDDEDFMPPPDDESSLPPPLESDDEEDSAGPPTPPTGKGAKQPQGKLPVPVPGKKKEEGRGPGRDKGVVMPASNKLSLSSGLNVRPQTAALLASDPTQQSDARRGSALDQIFASPTATKPNATAAASGVRSPSLSSVGDSTIPTVASSRKGEKPTASSSGAASSRAPNTVDAAPPESAASGGGVASVAGSVSSAATASVHSKFLSPQEVEADALGRGFLAVNGKFDGDPYERLYLKVDTRYTSNPTGAGKELNKTASSKPMSSSLTSQLVIRVVTGEEIVFDLTAPNVFVCEDPSDDTVFVVDHSSTMIIFKCEKHEDVEAIFSAMPPALFDVRDGATVAASLKSIPSLGTSAAKSSSSTVRQKPNVAVATARRHTKIGSVEDLLEGVTMSQTINYGPPVGPPPEHETIFMPPPIPGEVKGHRRAELIDDRIRKPKYSVRRVKQLCSWLNSLHIWPNEIAILSLHTEFCSGMLLAKLMQVLLPGAQFMQLNPKARSQKAAIDNLEQALGVIWRSKACNTSRIPKSSDIYGGSIAKISVLMQELFEVYVVKPLYRNAVKLLRWYNSILRQYQLRIHEEVFQEGNLASIWPHFQSGTALFCVIYHLFGPIAVGSEETLIKIDPMRIIFKPMSISEFRGNVLYLFQLLHALEIEVIWNVDDWLTSADTEFMMLQLQYIYDALYHRHCSLPPAQGHSAGVTSGPNGEPLVVGMIFGDTKPILDINSIERSRRTVLLGSGEDALPMLPIDNSGRESRFASCICPIGLYSNEVKIVRAPIHLPGLKPRNSSTRKNWNFSALPNYKEQQWAGISPALSVLRGHHQSVGGVVVEKRNDLPKSANQYILSAVNATKLNSSSNNQLAGASIITTGDDSILLSPKSERKALGISAVITPGKARQQQQQRQHQLEHPQTPKGGKEEGAAKPVVTFDTRNLKTKVISSIEGFVNETSPGAKMSNHISIAVELLEKDMLTAEEEMEKREELLASKYIDLEASAPTLVVELYERSLEMLERERKKLEEDRFQLQEHFALRLASIKSQHQEAAVRAEALKRKGLERSTSGSGPTAPTASTKPTAKTPKKSGSSDVPQLAKLEKGWISSAIKTSSHNYHLNKLQQASEQALKKAWEPPKLRERAKTEKQRQREQLLQQASVSPSSGTKSRSSVGFTANGEAVSGESFTLQGTSPLDGTGGGNNGLNITDGDDVSVAFARFKLRLSSVTSRWYQAKHQLGKGSTSLGGGGTSRIQDHTGKITQSDSSSFRSSSISGVRIAAESTQSSAAAAAERARRAAIIREEESKAFQYEDERRKRYLLERRAAAASSSTVAATGGGGAATAAVPARTMNSSFSPMSVHFNASDSLPKPGFGGSSGPAVSTGSGSSGSSTRPSAEVEASYRWLCSLRALTIADRVKKQYLFRVTIEEFSASTPSGDLSDQQRIKSPTNANNGSKYLMEWFEKTDTDHAVGSINLADISELFQSGDDLTFLHIVVQNSTKALRGTGGRPAVVLEFGSPGECAKFRLTLQTLMNANVLLS